MELEREDGCVVRKEWQLYEDDKETLKAFADELQISLPVAGILWHRGIRTKDAAERFLDPETKQEFYDPFLMKDMTEAVSRIEAAIERQESIAVYGDYDVDGMTASSVLVRSLRKLGASVSSYIPDRFKEGYGLHTPALQRISEEGTALLISVDCGITAMEEVEAMRGTLDIIITDHHLPGSELPSALAVVDPHREDCPYPFKDLAGVGVAFKLCQALWKKIRGTDFQEDLELVALGTIADLVPLFEENRKLVRMGLKRMEQTELPGLKALIDIAGLKDKPLNTGHVGFQLAPRLNAAGRMDTASKGRDLLLTDDTEQALQWAKELDDANLQRQEMERELLLLAEKELRKLRSAGTELHSIVLSGRQWHPGIIGLAASKFVDKYYLPTVILSEQGEFAKGSCRSIRGLHMYQALEACREHLVSFGGHSQAAGLTIRTEDIPAFRKAFDLFVKEHLSDEDYIPKLSIDALLPPQKITFSLMDELEKLAPYGIGNPQPLFGCREARGISAHPIGKDRQHLMFYLNHKDSSIKAVSWNQAGYAPIVNREPMDLAYVPEIDEWMGRRSVECMISSMAPAKSHHSFPDRAELIQLYRLLNRIRQENGTIPMDICELLAAYQAQYGETSLYVLECGLSVFEELGLLHSKLTEKGYDMPPAPKEKTELTGSRLYRRNHPDAQPQNDKRT